MTDHELHRDDEAQTERGRALIQAAVEQTRAPLALRERIEAERSRARPKRRTWALGGSFAAAAAAVLIAGGLAGGGAGGGGARAGPGGRVPPPRPAPPRRRRGGGRPRAPCGARARGWPPPLAGGGTLAAP